MYTLKLKHQTKRLENQTSTTYTKPYVD